MNLIRMGSRISCIKLILETRSLPGLLNRLILLQATLKNLHSPPDW